MAITLVLSQVVGQAFVVKPDGQVSPAQANMQLHTGDLISVPKGKNAWLVTEDEEQVDVLDEALFLGDEGFNSLDLPSDVLDIIASLEQGDDPTQLEGKETAAGEELNSSSAGEQVIIESNGYRGGVSGIGMFDTTGLSAAGLTGAQIESLSSARYANLFNRASNAQEENIEAKISGDLSATIIDGDVLTASGNLTSSDADGADNRFIAETIQTLRGEMTINEDGSWTYTSTDPTGAIERLGEGDTLNEYVTVRAADGTEQRITLTFEGSNDVPVFSAISSGEITESDGIMKAAGSINIIDPDAGESFMQPGSFKGEWGTVIIDRAGNWSYTVDNSNKAAINSMTDGEKVTDTITVYSVDGTETIITLSINGANDDAIIGGDIATTIVDNSGTLSTSGTLSSTDIDGNDNAFIAETLTTPRGEVTIDENGNWTYTSTDPTGAIERLAEGETLTEVVTVRAEDGTEQQIVLTIEGVNDAPVFSAITTRDVYETNDVISVNGSLNIVDPDAGESFMLAGTYLGDFGSVTIDRAGNWTYTTDPSQSTSLDTLREGEQRVDTITVRSVDGTETDILVTIIGTNDPAQIAGDIVGTIVEADGTLSTSGQLTSTDVDGNDNVFTPQTIAGRWGEITIDADGSWTYVTTDDNGAINRLGDGEQLTDTLSVRAEDGTIQTITITIDGTNDVAVFGGMTNVSVTEADGQLSTSGSVNVSDADTGQSTFQAGTFTGEFGDITIDTAGNWTYTTDPVHSNTFDALDAGDPLPDTITVYAQDGTPLDITVTITGTDDLPVVSGQFGQSLVDTTTGNTLTASGTINISDVDADDAPTFEDTRIESEYGVLELVDGNWTYTLDKEAASALNAGEVDTDVITLTASDGTQQNIVISITGTNDAPVLSGDTTGSLSDDDNLTISGSIEIIDPDTGDSPTVPNDTIDGSYGTLALVDGEWSYTLDPDSTASLPEGERTTDTITITASDGSTHDIVITITGTDQLPVLEGDTTGAIKEGSSTLIATGTINLVDVDEGQTPTLPNGTTEGAYGSLELIDGAWAYTLDPELAQYLDEGQTTQDTISVTASDGTVHDIVITITGSEDAAVLSGETSGSVSDETGALTTGGSLSISDPDTNDNPTLPDSNQQGQYGSFSMVDGNWTYTLDPELAEALGEGVEVTDTITITDSMGGTHALVISVTGTDDAAVLTGDTTGVLTEGTDVITTSGTIELIDPDSGDTPTIENTTVTGTFGSLALVDGEWTYTLNPGAAQSLGADQSTTDTITLTDSEGKEHDIVITIEGTDDAAVVSGDFTGTVTAQIGPEITISNVFVLGDDIDVDGEQFNASSQPSSMHFDSAGFSATITDSDGQLNNSANQTIELDGQSYPVSVTATVEYTDVYDNVFTMGVLSIDNGDGTSTTLLVQIGGPDILPGTDLNVVEGSYTEVSSINYVDVTDATTVSGSLSISDADANESPSFTNTTIDGDYGTFTLTDGAWTYTLDPAKANALNDNQTEQEVFTLTASDGTVQQITVDVTGADDAAIITGDSTASITEDSGAQTASGTITITDADTGDTPTIPNGTLAGEYGSLTLVDGAWTYTADSTSIQSLADGDTATDTITVTASDGTTQDIVITITGTNDAAVVTGDTTGDVTDQNASTSGSINVSDVDNGETATIDNTTIAGEYGSLVLVDGNWTYNVDSEKAQTLPDGQSANDVFTLTASDGSTHQITVTVEGTDDAAAVTGDLSASVAEGGEASVSGSININDPDAAVQPTLENGTVEGEYGSLTLTDGEWTYTVNPSKAQSLGDGDSETDTITITASDGSAHQITITVTGSDDASVVTGVTTGGVDLGADTPETSTSGTLSISDVDDGDSPSFTNTTIDGDYGTFTLTDGAWTYTLDPAKANALNDNQTEQEVFTLTASDGTVQQITVDVTGVDDAAIITGDSTASITEDSGAQTASGTITITDADTGDTPTIPNGTLAGEYGSLTLVDGAWTYTADSASIQSLADGDTATDTITVTASDGTTQDIVITITGTNDAAVVTGDTTGDVTDQNASTSGSINVSDVDNGETATIDNTTIEGEYGSLVLVDGNWTYNVDSEKAQTLPDGQSANDVFTLTASDGSTHQITVTVEGTDDAAAVTGDLSASVAEGGEASVSGSININDPDAAVQPTLENGTVEGEYGSLTLTDGEWTYTVDPSKAQSLGDGDSETDTITVTASDGSAHQITITVTGSDDASVVTGVTTGGIDLGADTPETSTSGTLSISDVDDGDSPSFTNTTIDGDYGTFTLTDGAWTYTLDPSKANALNDNQTEQEVFTLTASDGTVQQITVDVTGADDAAVITGDTTAAITEDVGTQTASGTITITDADTGDTPTIPNGTLAGEYGSLTLVDGAWTYTADSASIQSLADGDTATDTITVTASDGTTQDIVITITGTDDAAVISGETSGNITEDTGAQTASGTITITDADTGETPTIPNGTLAGEYGSLTLVDGAWTYTVDTDAVQSLAQGQETTDTITLTASDGSTVDVVISLTGTNDAAVVTGDLSASVAEGGEASVSGSININDPDAAVQPTLENGTVAGEYGSLTLTDGEWTYTVDPSKAQSLGDGDSETDTITITASDGSTHQITITVTGSDDASVVTGVTTGGIDLGADTPETSVSGTLSISDVDDGDSPSFTNTTIDGDYGTFTLTDGAWTYTLDPSKANALNDNQTEQEVFTLTASDGTVQQITVDVTGADDAAVITGDTTASMTEDSGAQTASGTITITDADTGDTPTIPNGTLAGEYGSLTLVDGAWTYIADSASIQSLADGDTATDTITVTASDGTTQDIVITITGTDDAAVVTGDTTGDVTDQNASTSGSINVSDVDNGETATIDNTTIAGEYGSLVLVDGNWTYNVDSEKAQTLPDGQSANDVFTLTASDGSTHQITVTVEGTDDAAAVTGDLSASVAEGGEASVSGAININDPDAAVQPTLENGTVAGEYGSLTLTDGEWTYTVDPSKAQSLGDGDSETDTITITASDGSTHQITITVTGSDDASVVTGVTTGGVDLGADTPETSTSGTLSISDVDDGDSPSFTNTTIDGDYGTFTLTDGAWTYTLDPSKANALNDNQTEQEVFTLTASDGTVQQITVDVTGADDAAVITGDTTAAITEDVGTQTASGTITITDADTGDTPTIPNGTLAGEYGSLTLVDGAWTYTLNQEAAQSLNQDQEVTDTITVTASDGSTQDIVISLTGTDDAAVVSGDTTSSLNLSDGITIGNAFVINENFIAEDSHFNTWDFPSTLTFNDSGTTVVINDDDSRLDGDGGSGGNSVDEINEQSTDSTQTIILDGETLSVNVDYSLQYTDTEGNVYTFAVVDVDTNANGTHSGENAESGRLLIQLDGPEITPNTSLTFVPDSYSNVTSLNYSDIAEPVTATGTLTISDADSADSPSFENTTIEGEYGSLTLVDGEWTYTLDPEKAQAIASDATATDTITLTATDGTTQSITISLQGSDDAAVITGDTTAAITEDVGTQSASGTLNIVDPDSNQTPTFTNETITGEYGSLTMVDGEWTYTVNTDAVQSLNEGQEATDTITVTASDGSTQDIVISLTGTDDAAEISGTTTAALTEGNTGDTITASGTLTVTDPDGDAVDFPNSSHNGTYGSLEMVDGEWTYTMNNDATQSLNEGQVVQDTITVTASDGTTQDIVIDITGSDDAAVLSGTSTATITDTNASSQNVTVGRGSDGTWDATNGDNLYLNLSNVNSDAAYTNSVGYYVLDAGGNVVRAAIIFDNAHSTNGTSVNINTAGGEKVGLFMIPNGDSQGFNVGSVSLSFGGSSVTAYQGGASSTTFVSDSSKNSGYDNEYNSGTYSAWEDIAGGGDRDHNDVTFYVSATQQQESPITASGSVSVSDVDSGDTPTLPNTTVQGEFGSLTMTNGNWTYTFDPDKASAIDEETLETIVITDSEGGKHEIVIAIQGTDDAPIVTGVFSGAVTEGDADDVITVSGTISISDADADDTPEFENTTIDGQYGSLTLADGEWTYTLDPVKSQVLSETDFVQDTITLTATDGTTQNVVISVTGTDDAPFVVGTNSATVIAPDSMTSEYVDVKNAFVLNEGYSFTSGDMMYLGSEPPTLDFNKAPTTVRFYDNDSYMDGDDSYNERADDLSQTVEINGTRYVANFDYTTDYTDRAGNVYTFAVVDVDFDGDQMHDRDSNEQGNFIIQLSGPEITAGTQLNHVPGSLIRDGKLSYQELADNYSQSTIVATGSLSLSDVDNGDSPYFANTEVNGSYGSLSLVDGNWTYTLDPQSTPMLSDNDTVNEVITLTATDGTQTQINVTIGGSQAALIQSAETELNSSLSDVISLDDVTFSGSDSNDRIAGSDSADVLLGNAGHDVILGGGGNDFIDGGLGDDLILGGQGNDLMAGGAGSDTFAFLNGDQSTSSTPAVDHIADFDTSQDAINLSDLMQTEPSDTLESFLSLIDDGEGNAMLNIASQGDGNVDQQVVFDNMSVEDMASAYSVDISGMTSEQVSTSVIDAMIMQSKMIID